MTHAPAPEDLLSAVDGLSPERRALLIRRLARNRDAELPTLKPLPRTGTTQRFVAAPGQQQLHYQYELDPGAVNYLLPIAVRIRGELDTDALAAALDSVVARHEALRTGFALDAEHGVVQVVRPAHEVRVELPVAEARFDEVDSLVDRLTDTPFDLSEPPLLRAALWRLHGRAASDGQDPAAADGQDPAVAEGTDPAEGPAWLLTLCVHHIVVDGWSLGVLVDELSEGYAAARAGRPARLPELPLNYPDFAAERHDWLAGDEARRQLAHWRERLAGVPACEIAADRPRPARPTFDGAAVRIDLDASLVDGIGRLARSEQATPFMVLLAAYAAVLHRWSAEPDLVIGTAVAGRTRPEWEPLVGFFVNTLPLRVGVDAAGTFRALLRAARESALDGFAHQQVPYPRIIREAGGERRNGRSALVRNLLALRNVPMSRLDLPGVHTEPLNRPKTGSDLDLSLEFSPAEHGDGLTGWLSYSADLFEPDTARRIGAAVHRVLSAAVADGDTALADLPYLSEDDHRTVESFTGLGDPLGDTSALLDGYAAAVAATPDTVAVVADVPPPGTPASLTYRDLDERAERLARVLRHRGVRPDDRVAVCLPRSLDLPAAVLAVLKAGATLLPLESEHPAERLAELVADATPHTLITDRDRAAHLPDGPERLLIDDLDDLEGLHELADDADPSDSTQDTSDTPATPQVPGSVGAYVLHTSGSTGRPKGVVVTRDGLAARLSGMRTELGVDADDVVLHKTPVSADTSMWELLVALTTGGTLVLAAPERHADVRYLYDVLTRHRVTVCFFVPSVLRPAVDQGGLAAAGETLRLLVSAGEELPAQLANAFLAQVPHARLINSYGPTETTINITEHTVTARATTPVPIGRPVPGTDVHVLDPLGRVQPVGVPGELYAGGVQVARGYLGRPGQTAERYVPHLFVPGARLYRTGDRARWRADGTLEFLGRTDHQVKIRGYRVEPGEVEATLRGLPEVADAVVVAQHSKVGGLRLVGYVTGLAGEPEPDVPALRSRLHALLPSPMVPDQFVVLDALPVTAYGKVDRARLPEPGPRRADAAPTPPAGPLQEVLAGIWREHLEITDVGIHDDFFVRGGHSVLATLMVSHIRELFRLELPLHFFVEAPTVATLADLMRTEGAESGIDVDRVADLVQQVQRMSFGEVAERLEN